MPLEKQVVPIILSGLDAGGTDAKLAQGLLKLENGEFTRQGAIVKRKGLTEMDGYQTDDFMATHLDKAVVVGENIEVHDGESANLGGFTSIVPGATIAGAAQNTETTGYRAGLLDVGEKTLFSPEGRRLLACDILEKGNVVACCYTVDVHQSETFLPTQTFLHIIDRYTGATLATTTLDLSADKFITARLIDSGTTNLWCVYNNEAEWRIVEVDVDTGNIGTAIDLTTDGMTDISPVHNGKSVYPFDCCALDDANNTIIVSYASGLAAGPVWDVTVASISTEDNDATWEDEYIAEAGASWALTACFKYDEDEAVILWVDDEVNGTVRWCTVDSAPILDKGPADIGTVPANCRVLSLTGITTTLDTEWRAYWTGRVFTTTPPGDPEVFCSIGRDATVDAVNSAIVFGRACLASKPFIDSDSNVHLGLYYQDYSEAITDEILNPTLFWGRDENVYDDIWSLGLMLHRTVGKSLASEAAYTYREEDRSSAKTIGYGASYDDYFNPYVAPARSTGTDAWLVAGLKWRIRDGLESWMGIVRLDISKPTQLVTNELMSLLSIPNSCPLFFDGLSVFEQGFLTRPNALIGSAAGAAGSLPAGTYSYKAFYEWYDNQGNRHLSPPSLTIDVVCAAAESITIDIPTCRFTNKQDVKIVLYRTGDATSSAFYRLFTLSNSVGVETVSFTDDGDTGYQDSSDTDVIKQQESPYVDAGELQDESPVSYRISTIFKDRMFYVPRKFEETDVLYTKTFIAGEAPEFNTTLLRSVSPSGGRIMALDSMGDRLIIFKRSQIFATNGDGWDANGSGLNFAEPYFISETIGCSNAKSVVFIPDGIMFQSDFGIYIISKDMQVQYIGAPVKHWTDSLTITSATLIQKKNHAIFTTSDGVALVYNYLFGQWSTFTNYEAKDATVASTGTLYIKRQFEDKVASESSATGDAASDLVPMTIETGWYSLAQVVGYQRIYRMVIAGYNIDEHTLTIKTAYDFEPTWTDEQTFNSGSLSTFDVADYFGTGLAASYQDQAYLLEVHGSRQKCTAVRFSISDSSTNNLKENFSLNALGLLVGVKSGNTKALGNARSV